MAVPITIATEPKVIVALLWVIGIFTSIIFWEIINYIYQLKKAQTDTQKEILTYYTDETLMLAIQSVRNVARDMLTDEQTVRNVAPNVTVNNLPNVTVNNLPSRVI